MSDGGAELNIGACCGFPDQRLEFRKGHLDGVQIG